MKSRAFKILILLFVLIGCGSSKNEISTKKPTDLKAVVKEQEPITTAFYQILTFATPKSKIYKLSDRKNFDLKITNIGTKDLFVPKWFDKSAGKASELYIELYIKENDEFEVYKQKSMVVQKSIHTRTFNRPILSSKNGTCLSFEDIELDTFLKIVDEGKYLAKVYIDLSNFGYFKIIESSAFFEVVSDSTKVEELKKPDIDILKRTDAEQYSADIKMRNEAFKKRKAKIKKDTIN